MTSGLGAKTWCLGVMTKIDPCYLGQVMGALKTPKLAWNLKLAT
jgi:hypothetical protein